MKRKSLASVSPKLAAEWHPTKNGDLTADMVGPQSHKKVWWYLPYDDPKTGKHFDFEWQATVASRTSGTGCPFLTSHAVWTGYNDLQTVSPQLAKEWHSTKNGNLLPNMFTSQSEKKVWWEIEYFDTNTKRMFNFEWQAAIKDRFYGDGCPYISGQALFVGYNDLETKRPDLANEWDFNKNKSLTPKDILFSSHKKVWWNCKKGHSWFARIDNRVHLGNGCPYCSQEKQTSFPEMSILYYMKQAFNDVVHRDRATVNMELDIYIPSISIAIEYDGCAWHKNLTNDCKKDIICKEKGIKLFRIREYGCPEISSTTNVIMVKPGSDLDLEAAINKIAKALSVTIDVNINRDRIEIFNLIEYEEKSKSLLALFPDIAKEWNYDKNGKLKPEHVCAYSNKIVWWKIDHADPHSNNVVTIEWQAKIIDRTYKKLGCPYISGSKVIPNYNSLLATNPEIAAEWNYDKNLNKTDSYGNDISDPSKIKAGSHHKVWWKCKAGHEWEAKIELRGRLNHGCPECYKASRKSPKIKSNDIII